MTVTLLQQKTVPLNFDKDKVELLKKTVCKDATDHELELFIHVCNRTGLDPFRNQIYAIKRKDRMTIQTGIDGFRLIAERTERYSPGREPTYSYDQQGKLVSATSHIKKLTHDGTWHEVSATAYWNEYVQEYNGKPSQFWSRMPHNQLAKCAESLALRKAFPADFSGLYTTEEMAQADNEIKSLENEAKPKEIIELEDLKPEDISSYINKNWPDHAEKFQKYMEEIMKVKKINYRKCITLFESYKDQVKEHFIKWLSLQHQKELNPE